MTSNQIAYAQTLESQRHNKISEDETQRHNLEVERLNAHELQIKEDFNQATIAYNNRMADIQRDYNEAYLEWQQVSGTRKLELEEQMNSLTAQKNAITEQYYKDQKALKATELAIESDRQAEVGRHNAQLELIESERNANALFIAEKQDLYNRYALDTESNIKLLNLQQENARLTLLQEQNSLKLAELELSAINSQTRNKIDYLKAATEGAKTSILKTKTALETVNDFVRNLIFIKGAK